VGRDDAGLYVGSLDSTDRTLLRPFNDQADVVLSTLAYSPPGYVLYVHGQRLMAYPIDLRQFRFSGPPVPVVEGVPKMGPGSAAFSVSNTGLLAYWTGTGVHTSQITWLARDGTAVGKLGSPGGYTSVALAPDERQIVVSRIEGGMQSAIWVLSVTRDTATRISFDPVSLDPIWSPDNTSIAYGSAHDGPPSLFRKAASGAGQDVLLFKSARANRPTDWCAGGSTIVFETRDAKTQFDIWTLSVTDRKAAPLLQTRFNEREGRSSPDGRWLAYTSDETGRPEVYVTGFPTAEGKWPISTNGGSQPTWRGDGTELFYVALDGTVTAVRVRTGATFEPGAVTRLFPLRGTSYAVTANGQRFLTNEPIAEMNPPPISIVLNWTAALKK